MSEILGIDVVNVKLNRLLAIGGLDRSAYAEMGQVVRSEIIQNFRVGGRPEQWKKSLRVLRHGGMTLRKSGALMNSMGVEPQDDGVAVGTNKVYARIQALGGTIVRYAQSRLAVTMKTFKAGMNKGKTLFAKTGLAGSFTRHTTTGQYTITIDARDYRYISPQGASIMTAVAMRHLMIGMGNG